MDLSKYIITSINSLQIAKVLKLYYSFWGESKLKELENKLDTLKTTKEIDEVLQTAAKDLVNNIHSVPCPNEWMKKPKGWTIGYLVKFLLSHLVNLTNNSIPRVFDDKEFNTFIYTINNMSIEALHDELIKKPDGDTNPES